MKRHDLADLNLDEVSLVGKAATGKRFLIFKSQGGTEMRQQPARANFGRARVAPVSKADIESIVKAAVEPIRKENEELRAILRKKDYVDIAKSEFSELATPEEGAEILKSLEALPSEARKPILKALKHANAAKREAGKLLYHPFGSDIPAPGSSSAQFEELVTKELDMIKKSSNYPTDPKVLRAKAVAQVSKSNPQLAKAVVAEERANVVKMHAGLI